MSKPIPPPDPSYVAHLRLLAKIKNEAAIECGEQATATYYRLRGEALGLETAIKLLTKA